MNGTLFDDWIASRSSQNGSGKNRMFWVSRVQSIPFALIQCDRARFLLKSHTLNHHRESITELFINDLFRWDRLNVLRSLMLWLRSRLSSSILAERLRAVISERQGERKEKVSFLPKPFFSLLCQSPFFSPGTSASTEKKAFGACNLHLLYSERFAVRRATFVTIITVPLHK